MPNQKLAETLVKNRDGSTDRTIYNFLDTALSWLYITEQEHEELIFYRKEVARIIYLLLKENHQHKKFYLKYLDSVPDDVEAITASNLNYTLKSIIEGIEVFYRDNWTDLEIVLQELSLVGYTLAETEEDSGFYMDRFDFYSRYFQKLKESDSSIFDTSYVKENRFIQGRKIGLFIKKEKGFRGWIKFNFTVWVFRILF